MKKTLLLASVACLFSLQANAEVNPYVSAKLKYSFMDNSDKMTDSIQDNYFVKEKYKIDDDVLGGSVAAGIAIPNAIGQVRTELEYTKNDDAEKTIDETKAKIKTQSVFFNAYYDFKTDSKLTPYIGAGIGATKLKASADEDSFDDTVFSWQVGAGAAYALTDKLSLDAGYRFVNYGSFTDTYKATLPTNNGLYSFSEKNKISSTAQEVYLGLRYSF